MTRKVSIIASILLLAGFCRFAQAQGTTIYINKEIPFAESENVANKVLRECNLPQEQAEFIVLAAKDRGMTVVRDDEAVKAGKGRILLVELTSAYSEGNAWTGHLKQVSIQGKLMDNGVEVGSFTGVRTSGGGFAAGYKTSCAVLNRCVKALAKDIAAWLQKPEKNSRIGE